MSDNHPLSEQFAKVAEEYCNAEFEASRLEDTQSAYLAECITQFYPDISVNKAEHLVKSMPQWTKRIEEKVEARRKANRLKLKLRELEIRHSEWQSEEANQRIQARL